MELGKQIEKARKAKGLTRYRMSKLMDTSQSYYTGFETGETNPSLFMLKKISEHLDASITINPDGSTVVKDINHPCS